MVKKKEEGRITSAVECIHTSYLATQKQTFYFGKNTKVPLIHIIEVLLLRTGRKIAATQP